MESGFQCTNSALERELSPDPQSDKFPETSSFFLQILIASFYGFVGICIFMIKTSGQAKSFSGKADVLILTLFCPMQILQYRLSEINKELLDTIIVRWGSLIITVGEWTERLFLFYIPSKFFCSVYVLLCLRTYHEIC